LSESKCFPSFEKRKISSRIALRKKNPKIGGRNSVRKPDFDLSKGEDKEEGASGASCENRGTTRLKNNLKKEK